MKNIKIKDFRAFHDEVKTDIQQQQHSMLLYGENGAGKSSIFEALKIIFFYSKIQQQVIQGANSHEAEAQLIQQWKLQNLCKLSSTNDFSINFDNQDYSSADVSMYRVCMIANSDLPITDVLSVRSLLQNVFFTDFDVDVYLADNADFLLEYVSVVLWDSFFEKLELEYDQTDEYRLVFRDPGRNDLTETGNLRRCFNEAKIKLVSLLILLVVAEHTMITSESEKTNLLVLDDIINSLDVSNRVMLIKYIFEHFPDEKVHKAIFTHNVSFFNLWHYYVNEILHSSDSWFCADLIVSGTTHRLVANYPTNVQSLKEEFEHTHDNDNIGNKLRRYFEYLLFKMTKMLQVGSFNESSRLINILVNRKRSIYFKVHHQSHEVLDIYDMVDRISAYVRNVPEPQSLRLKLQKILSEYNGSEFLDDLLPVIDDLKVFQKVVLHQSSHGHEGKDTVGDNEIYATLHLLEKLENAVLNQDNKDVYTM